MLLNTKRLLVGLVYVLLILNCENDVMGNSNSTLIDNDGNEYNTIKIGNQIWSVENLRTTKYNDGTTIPNIADNILWENDTLGACCSYDNTKNTDSIIKFGLLYNWYAINTGKLAPTGWRIPTDEDWNILQEYLISNYFNHDSSKEGNKIAKSISSKTDWDTLSKDGAIGYNLLENNRSGFSAFPSGHRYTGRIIESNYEGLGKYTTWWTSSETGYSNIWIRELGWGNIGLGRPSTNCKICGFSVRLIKN